MRITCPSCDTSYTIPDDKIGAKGRQVKCASCGTKWQVSLADGGLDSQPVDVDDLFANNASRMGEAATSHVASLSSAAVLSAPVAATNTVEAGMAATMSDGDTTAVDFAGALDSEDDDDNEADTAAEAALRNDIESLAKKPKIQVKKGKPSKPKVRQKFDFDRFLVRARPVFGAATLVLSIGVVAGAVVLRTPITSAFPSLASLYAMVGLPVNLRGLDIGHLQMMREVENAQPVLVVEGELSNATASEHPVPAIRFALRGDDLQEIYAWSIEPKQAVLTPGATMRFRTRLASPPEQAADIQVRMIDRRNQQAALHE